MAVATTFSTVMAQLTGNSGGAINSLPSVNVNGARVRQAVGTIVLASQAIGAVIGVARLPLQAVISSITAITDTSLGSSTIALGDSNSGAIYAAATTLTATDTPTSLGKTSTTGVPITTGYDCVSGASTNAYEDMVLTVAVAALPAAGNLRIIVEYGID